MLREDMKYEEGGQLHRRDGVESRYKYPLLGESVNNYENRSETGRRWELLYEVHADGVPWLLQDQELLEKSIRTMSWGLGPRAGCTRFAKVLHECS
jgi:hypothetical protein